MNETGEENRRQLELKITRAGTGLRGFVVSLAAGLTAMAAQAPVAITEYFTGSEMELISMILGWITALSITAVIVSFGILISALLMNPRGTDIRPDLAKNIPPLVKIIAGAASIFACAVLCSITAIFMSLYLKTGSILYCALALFCISVLLFSLSTVYALLKTTEKTAGHSRLKERISGVLLTGETDAGFLNRFMGRIEWGLSSTIALALYFLFQGESIMSAIHSFRAGDGAASHVSNISSADSAINIMSIIIILFAAVFTIKSLRTFIQFRKN